MIIFFFLNVKLNKLILSALQNHNPTWDHSHLRMRMQTHRVGVHVTIFKCTQFLFTLKRN